MTTPPTGKLDRVRAPSLSRSEALDLVLGELGEALQKSESPAEIVPTESTKLMGTSAPLDSVGLVSLIVGIEREIEARYGVRLELADERAMSRRPGPFRNAGTLADYVAQRVAEP